MTFRIFVVDDDRHYSRLLSYRLEKAENCDVHVYNSGEQLLDHLDEEPHLVLLDIMMPGIGGMEALKKMTRQKPHIPVVMVSAQGAIEVAVDAMKLGAYDYITKGQDDIVKLDAVVRNIREKVSMERELETLRSEVSRKYGLKELIGDSPAMEKVYRLVNKALRGDITVAIQGESGTGKELVAKAIHYNSPRSHGPFVVVNCAAIPRDLMESEFFGHEKGSFTGAYARKIGKFEQADNGTIFLDEIGELDLDLQAKLLRALQNREIQRVGGNDTIEFDARVICATNRDVIPMIREGKFREDLYYRLFQYPISLPPLRERGQDILVLGKHFLKEYIKDRPEFRGRRLSPAARRAIVEYSWPGNVRELKSAVERAILISDDEEIQPSDLMIHSQSAISPWNERMTLAQAADGDSRAAQLAFGSHSIVDDEKEEFAGVIFGDSDDDIVSLEDLKRQAVERAYHICDSNVDKAAVELGIGRATMYRLLKKYKLMN
jgi:DNA-binding NtrC family response regulator